MRSPCLQIQDLRFKIQAKATRKTGPQREGRFSFARLGRDEKGFVETPFYTPMMSRNDLPQASIHIIPFPTDETLAVNCWKETQLDKGMVAFEHVSTHDCRSFLQWTIVEYDGTKWGRASAAGLDRVREAVSHRFVRDATVVDVLVTTLMHTLVRVHEHEDGQHAKWIVE